MAFEFHAALADAGRARELPEFRSVYYLGSKLRLVGGIRDAVVGVASGAAVCDLFAGSGAVSHGLSHAADVVAADIQEYARVLCSAVLRPPRRRPVGRRVVDAARRGPVMTALAAAIEPLMAHEARALATAAAGDPAALCELLEDGSIVGALRGAPPPRGRALRRALGESVGRLERGGLRDAPASAVSRHFGGIYFSFAQAVALDALLDEAHGAAPAMRDTLLAAVLATASEAVNTVGKQFAQPIRPRDAAGRFKHHLLRQILRDRADDVLARAEAALARYAALPAQPRAHRIVRADYRDVLAAPPSGVGVYYADPPYTRDHYSRYYHALETMCLRDDPAVSTMRRGGETRLSRALYRADRHQSPFCIKSQAPPAFEALFAGVRALGAPLVVSYSSYSETERARPRLMRIDDLLAIARRHYRRVDTVPLGSHTHNKLNHQRLNNRVFRDTELLIVARP